MNTDNKQPILSIVIPIYNVEEFLEQCLDSVEVSVRALDAEVLLIDDGSKDRSTDIAREYVKGHDKFFYYRKENGGLSDARNYGADRAKGKYLAFVDSDDLVAADIYENMIRAAEYNQADLTVCDVVRCNSQITWLSGLHRKAFDGNLETVTDIHKNKNLLYDTTAWNKLILKSFWDENGFRYPVGWRFEDMPVSLRMHHKANKVVIVRQTGYLWRVRDKATKSITQENNTSVNLVHRLAMLEDMFEYMEKEIKNDPALRDAFRFKILNLDLIMFIDELPALSKELGQEYLDRINSFLDRRFDDDDFERLPLIFQQKYRYLKERDIDQLKKTIRFEEKHYFRLPYEKDSEGRIRIEVTDPLFTVADRDGAKDSAIRTLVENISLTEMTDDSVRIEAFALMPRVEVASPEDQTFEAMLINDTTGERIPLPVERRKDLSITAETGFMYDLIGKKGKTYNYDWAGFTILLDLNGLLQNEKLTGNNYIVVSYENCISRGSYLLSCYDEHEREISDGSVISGNGYKAKITYDASKAIAVNISKDAEKREHFIHIEDPVLPRLVYAGKDLELHSREGCLIAFTEELRAQKEKCILDVSILGPELKDGCDLSCDLTYQDRAKGTKEVLANARSEREGDRYRCIFEIDFSDPEITADLFEDIRILGIDICSETWCGSTDIIVKAFECARFETEDQRIRLYGDDGNRLVLDVACKWKDEDASIHKRNYTRNILYPKYREEAIVENRICFESVWGKKYNCNPAAMYEYILENHPEYECIWFLVDPHTPIKGNALRVKRGSREYYYYLATTKYIIENANLPNAYKKRKGQIEVQTMHGTPFKSFGLDIKEEWETEAQKVKFIKRNARWDYLVAQGEFTKNMAWRWFRYNKTVLETGYPRTDAIYKVDEEAVKKTKQSLGLPEDKKIILYAPTWRDQNSFVMELDLERMKESLSEDYILLIRLHYFVADKYNIPEDGEFIYDVGKANKIEDLFPLADILITDYSSVMFDFSLTGKPMIFYTYDLKEYTEETRGAYFDISTEAPGTLAMTTGEVIDAIRNIDRYCEMNKERVEAFHSKYLTYENPGSCEKVYDAVFVEGIGRSRERVRQAALSAIKRLMPEKLYFRIRKEIIRKRAAK